MKQGEGLLKLAVLYANKVKDCGSLYPQKCHDCEFNTPVFEWSEDPKLCAWIQELDNRFGKERK